MKTAQRASANSRSHSMIEGGRIGSLLATAVSLAQLVLPVGSDEFHSKKDATDHPTPPIPAIAPSLISCTFNSGPVWTGLITGFVSPFGYSTGS